MISVATRTALNMLEHLKRKSLIKKASYLEDYESTFLHIRCGQVSHCLILCELQEVCFQSVALHPSFADESGRSACVLNLGELDQNQT